MPPISKPSTTTTAPVKAVEFDLASFRRSLKRNAKGNLWTRLDMPDGVEVTVSVFKRKDSRYSYSIAGCSLLPSKVHYSLAYDDESETIERLAMLLEDLGDEMRRGA